MDHPPAPHWFDHLIAPRVLLLGVAVAFLACCLAGHLAGRRNHHRDFTRFHQLLSPESLYYPTVNEVCALARSRLDPNRVVVIVGGSSVLHGTGQPAAQVWTDRLQARLGAGYQVLNLAQRAGRSAEVGAVVAEILARDYPKLMLITDAQPGWLHPEPDGLYFKYFFWSAHYRGLLLPDAARDQRLSETVMDADQLERELGKEAAGKLCILSAAQQELRTGRGWTAPSASPICGPPSLTRAATPPGRR